MLASGLCRHCASRHDHPTHIIRQLNLTHSTIYIATGQVYYPTAQVQMHAYGLNYLSPYKTHCSILCSSSGSVSFKHISIVLLPLTLAHQLYTDRIRHALRIHIPLNLSAD